MSQIPYATISGVIEGKGLYLQCPHCHRMTSVYNENIQSVFGTTVEHLYCSGSPSYITRQYRIPESMPLKDMEYKYVLMTLKKKSLIKALVSRGHTEKLSQFREHELRMKIMQLYPASDDNLFWIKGIGK